MHAEEYLQPHRLIVQQTRNYEVIEIDYTASVTATEVFDQVIEIEVDGSLVNNLVDQTAESVYDMTI